MVIWSEASCYTSGPERCSILPEVSCFCTITPSPKRSHLLCSSHGLFSYRHIGLTVCFNGTVQIKSWCVQPCNFSVWSNCVWYKAEAGDWFSSFSRWKAHQCKLLEGGNGGSSFGLKDSLNQVPFPATCYCCTHLTSPNWWAAPEIQLWKGKEMLSQKYPKMFNRHSLYTFLHYSCKLNERQYQF